VPSTDPSLTLGDVHRIIRERCFTPTGTDRVGVEQEWLTYDAGDQCRRITATEVLSATADTPLTAGSHITVEPGGQVEISTGCFQPWPDAVAALAADGIALRRSLAPAGLGVVGLGLDPHRPPERTVDAPRYTAMEAFFDSGGRAGRTMMTCSASIQVNVDLGGGDEVGRRWRLAHDLGPVLAACFANSPIVGDRPSGHRSSRLVVWEGIDEGRTRPIPLGDDPCEEWARYALDAQVMLIRTAPDECVAVLDPFTFSDWVAGGHAAGHPTADDLAYHLTTLFPPVRPRGWLELRMLDSLPAPLASVAVAITTALLLDRDAGAIAADACAPVADRWAEAARLALGDPELADAAVACAAAALAALRRMPAPAPMIDACEAYVADYITRGRCPADDVLDRWAATPNTTALELEEMAWR
jgi:glutamate--cysteine ligase